MPGERDIPVLTGSLAPVLDAEIYTFATVSEAESKKLKRPLGLFRESEGISVICLLCEAQALGLKHQGELAKITLTVHSSLKTVGLTAHVSTALAGRGISCNVVAGFHHDHLFVPTDRAEEARMTLSKMS